MWKNFPLFPDSASSVARSVDALYFASLGITAFFSLLIAGAILYFAVRFRRRHPDELGVPERANFALEIAWSVIPFIILMVMFAWGAKVFFHLSRPPKNAVEYYAVGKQWMWKFQHPEGNREINELHVPLGLPVKLTMTSEDVIHSFFVPAFRVKADVIPGRYSTVWFEATKAGTYQLFCTEYCGAEHSRMIGRVTVMEPAAYQAWLTGGSSGQTLAASGEQLFSSLACNTCHRADTAVRGPILAGLFGSRVRLHDGSTVVADDDYLRESILVPGEKIVAGYQPVMPTFKGQVTEEQLLALLRYIKDLGPARQASAAGATSP
jgi:cytochrome c oxidase subunit 2